MVHSALTAAPTMFLERGGLFAEEPFNIRLGFYRENFYALASAVLRTWPRRDTRCKPLSTKA